MENLSSCFFVLLKSPFAFAQISGWPSNANFPSFELQTHMQMFSYRVKQTQKNSGLSTARDVRVYM